MKAGSLLSDDELGALRESASSPSSGEVCLEVCSMQRLSAFIYFLAQVNLGFEILLQRVLKSIRMCG